MMRYDQAVRPHKVVPGPKCGVFYLPQYGTPYTRHPLDLCHMRLTEDFTDEDHLKIFSFPH